ncbi:MAG: hypothetical protein LBD19_00650 [Endomicrobium sp.]|jgi:hypothetical protein|nr:hypothetical protein [Endomicrobium sp.]
MKKLVLMIMFFAVAQCWADPVHRSFLSDACVPEPEQQTQDGEEELILLQLLAVVREWQTEPQRQQRDAIIIEHGEDFFGFSN